MYFILSKESILHLTNKYNSDQHLSIKKRFLIAIYEQVTEFLIVMRILLYELYKLNFMAGIFCLGVNICVRWYKMGMGVLCLTGMHFKQLESG